VLVHETLPASLPERSLGEHVVAWMERWLRSPADIRDPLRLTDEQVRFVMHWFAVDERGRWVWRRGTLRRPKGWGKDPLATCLALAELVGPVRFDRFESGMVLGRHAQFANVQIGGTAEAQTRTTTSLLAPLVSDELRERHSLDIRDKRVKGVSIDGLPVELRPVTTSARSAEGARITAFISNETQHWLSTNGGHAMSDVIRRNLAKSPDGSARELSITNAHDPGEESVAALDDEAWRAQQMAGGGGDLLLDTREPLIDSGFDVDDDGELRAALGIAYGDSWWIDIERLMAECRDPRTSDAQRQRFYLNRLVAGDRSWLDPSIVDAAWRDWPLPEPGTGVSVGFDGSRTIDATAIVCTSMDSGFQWVAGVWERDYSADWSVPADEVNETVERIFDTWRVSNMYADPAWWEDDVWRWQGRWPESVTAVWMRGSARLRTARMTTAYRGALARQEAVWGGAAAGRVFRRHLLSAVERPLQAHIDDGRLHTIAKKSASATASIDIAVAAVLSWQARGDAVASGWRLPVRFSARRRAD